MGDHHSRNVSEPDVSSFPTPHGSASSFEHNCLVPTGEPAVEKVDQSGYPRLLPFLIRRDGVWLYRGSPIRRKAMLCLFGSMLKRDRQGQYWLRTPLENGIIQVEDAPFLAVELDFRGGCSRHQTLCLRTNMDDVVCVGPDYPILCDWDQPCDGAGAVPYVHLRDGDGAFPIRARITRAVHFELAALAVEGQVKGQPCLGVWSRNAFFPLSRCS